MSNALDQAVRTIMVQFSCSNKTVIPLFLPTVPPEMGKQDHFARKTVSEQMQGIEIIKPTPLCSMSNLAFDLHLAGWVLVKAQKQRRVSKDGEPYFTARFQFYREEDAFVDPSVIGADDLMRAAFVSLTSESFWRVRAFRNPLMRDGEVVPNQWAVSINAEVREQRITNDGTVRVMHGMNNRGARTRDLEPVRPNHRLCLHDKLVLIQNH